MIHEFQKPIPVETPLGVGYALYVSDSAMLENDVFTVVLQDNGMIKHFTSDQIQVSANYTFKINVKD